MDYLASELSRRKWFIVALCISFVVFGMLSWAITNLTIFFEESYSYKERVKIMVNTGIVYLFGFCAGAASLSILKLNLGTNIRSMNRIQRLMLWASLTENLRLPSPIKITTELKKIYAEQKHRIEKETDKK